MGKVLKMFKVATFFLLISFLALTNGQKFNKKKYNLKKIKEANAKLKELKPELEAAKAAVAQIQACMALAPNDPSRDEVCPEDEDRTTIATDNSGDRCGPQTLTNCGRLHDIAAIPADLTAGGAPVKTSNANTNTGTCFHTAPATGIYRICFHARFRQGGNAGDVTVQAGSTTYAAAFGDGDEKWRGQRLCAGDQLEI